jgi:selenocysteine lyase/cysteine desulfurase
MQEDRPMTPDFAKLRRDFPLLARKTYLNSGSYCALADSVRSAFETYLEERLTAGANWDLWVIKNESVRAGIARVLGAKPDEIAVTTSASAGINALASALDFSGRRNKVVISDFEFPTNAQIWHAQEKRGAKVIHAHRAQDGSIPLEHFEALIDEETQLVAVTQVCYLNGARLDIPGIARLAHARGARILVDCFQGVGALQFDVKELDLDFAVGGMLKYLLGTAGIGFLYVREQLIHELIPTNSGWFAQADIGAMDISANRPSLTARRFEAGTPPVVNCYAAEAGLHYLLNIGISAVEERIRSLTRRCMERLEEIGWPSVTPHSDERRGPTVAVPSRDAERLTQELLARGIVTSHRGGNIRAAFHFYNNDEDIDKLITTLSELRSELRG